MPLAHDSFHFFPVFFFVVVVVVVETGI
jgi:hypothetical protein